MAQQKRNTQKEGTRRPRRSRRSSSSRRSGVFLACWLLVAISLVILFFAKKDVIMHNLNNAKAAILKTDNKQKVAQEVGDEDFDEEGDARTKSVKTQNSAQPFQKETAPSEVSKTLSSEDGTAKANSGNKDAAKKVSKAAQDAEKSSKANPKTASDKNLSKTSTKSPSKEVAKLAPNAPSAKSGNEGAKMNVSLCFVMIDGNGGVSRRVTKRSVEKTSGVLAASIKELLRGPQGSEGKAGTTTLIPEGTRLLGASIKNGVAVLNLSEDFEYNGAGVDGYLASLMQIVYTATEFKSVSSVQILIGGEKRDYLGSDGLLPGLYIGKPLTRAGF